MPLGSEQNLDAPLPPAPSILKGAAAALPPALRHPETRCTYGSCAVKIDAKTRRPRKAGSGPSVRCTSLQTNVSAA